MHSYLCTFFYLVFLKLHHFLRSISFNSSTGEISFDNNGEIVAGFDIINWITFPNQTFLRVKVGRMDPGTLSDEPLTISEEKIIWPNRFNQVRFLLFHNGLVQFYYEESWFSGSYLIRKCLYCLPFILKKCPLLTISLTFAFR